MGRVTDNFLWDAREYMSGNLQMMLDELAERREAEKKGKGEAVLPIPCTKGHENFTVRQWFSKINGKLDELKKGILDWYIGLDSMTQGGVVNMSDPDEVMDACRIAEEAASVITALTSMLESMGIDEQMRQEAQKRVNEKNRKRGWLA